MLQCPNCAAIVTASGKRKLGGTCYLCGAALVPARLLPDPVQSPALVWVEAIARRNHAAESER
mgnify:FL=1